MKKTKIIIIFSLLTVALTAGAKNNYFVTQAYAFGFSASFNDSIIYFTEIHTVDSICMDKKNKFVVGMDNYSSQLKNYLEGEKDERTRTCVFFYDLKKEKLKKRYDKLVQKYSSKTDGFIVKFLTKDDFKFTPIDMYEQVSAQETNHKKKK